ncbi:sigma 54-interacting transcriptional regulator [Alicyclobacillus curvatus]|nr:sigma 54-interacting transcriptional regulator [Alicyclobacillus curvatus]
MDAIRDSADVLELILDTMYEGIVVVDERGRIQEMNDSYLKLLDVKRDDILGRHVTEIIENTRMHKVLETGIPERGHLQKIRGLDMIVHRIPIWKDGRIIGALGILVFESIGELYRLIERTREILRVKELGTSTSEEDLEAVPHRHASTVDDTIGQSPPIKLVKQLARKAARTPVTVLITGESGTGKEVMAQGIHYESNRANGPFVSVNCAAIPEHLLEAELFGYDDGAFTGAKKGGKPGQIESAHLGTLFLDEIGDMSLNMQAKLLRILEDREIQRVGGISKRYVNTRIISATNRNLEEMVRLGQFRQDLYYRLNIIRLHLPPLRERREDVPLLLAFYLEEVSRRLHKPPVQVSSEVVDLFIQYDWPGNIRELVHTVEVLVSLADSSRIGMADFPPHLSKFFAGTTSAGTTSDVNPVPVPMTQSVGMDKQGVGMDKQDIKRDRQETKDVSHNIDVRQSMAHFERKMIRDALEMSGGNKSLAAQKLGIHRSTLYEKIKRYRLQ